MVQGLLLASDLSETENINNTSHHLKDYLKNPKIFLSFYKYIKNTV